MTVDIIGIILIGIFTLGIPLWRRVLDNKEKKHETGVCVAMGQKRQ